MAGYKLSAALLNRKRSPGKVADGLALSFIRNKDGSLTAWQRVKVGDRERDVKVDSLAGEVTADWLQAVRTKAYAMKSQQGPEPAKPVTFEDSWRAFYRAITSSENSRWGDKTAAQAEAQMLNHIAPTGLWSMPVQEIRPTDVELALQDLRAARPKLAVKVLHKIGQVLSYAAHDLNLDTNAAKALKERIKATEKKVQFDKLPAITSFDGLGHLLHAIENSNLYLTTRVALLLQAYSAQRSGEVAPARRREFTFLDDGSVRWKIPRERMKIADPEKKPYDQVLVLPAAVARLIRRLPDDSDYLFTPRHGDSPHISVEAFSQAFQRLGFRGVAVPHGWRSSLKTLAEDAADEDGRPLFAARWVEDVLDHSPLGIDSHYTRAQAEKGMARVLAWWGDQLDAALKRHAEKGLRVT